jgi:hypothetical protein
MDSAGEMNAEGEGLGSGAGRRGRAEGEANTGGGDICEAAGTAMGEADLGAARTVGAGGVGVEILEGIARTVPAGVGVTETVVNGVVTGLALAGAALAVAVVVEVLDGACFTNVFEGASGGGVTSAFIFARARSAAGRSVSAAQFFSTVASVIVSLTVCGRSTPWIAVIAGANITRTSPRTVGEAVVSEFTCRSRRYRSMG